MHVVNTRKQDEISYWTLLKAMMLIQLRSKRLLKGAILSLSIFFLFQTNLCSQTEGDIFAYGFCSYTYEFENCYSPFDNSIIRFLGDTIDSFQAPELRGYFGAGKSAFQNDEISYFSNGYILANENGIIDSNLLEIDVYNQGVNELYFINTIQLPLFLNIKDSIREKVFLFYNKPSYESFRDTLFAYSELASHQVPNEDVIISKRNPLLLSSDTTLIGKIAACRHANGRDWWVIKIGKYHDIIYLGLLNFNGIEMQKINTTVPHVEYYGVGSASTFFNLEGTKFYIFNWTGKMNPSNNIEDRNLIYVYDFNRCTGEMSNPVKHDITIFSILSDKFYSCLSPDGTKMYISKSYDLDSLGNIIGEGGIFQYDFITRTFQKINGHNNNYPILSPNGKWILVHNMTTPPEGELLGQPTFDIIYNPNELGQNCNYQENQVILSSFGVGFPPNLANFRLGPIDGTICDSLGLDAPKEPPVVITKPIVYNIYPNPTNGSLTIDFGNENKHSLGFYNSLGQRIRQFDTTDKTLEIDLKSWGLATGMYFVEIRDLFSNQHFNTKVVYYAN